MSYRCGIGPGIPGLEPGPPRVMCDAPGCEVRIEIDMGSGPPQWLLKGARPRRGWLTIKTSDYTRQDWCPEHKYLAP